MSSSPAASMDAFAQEYAGVVESIQRALTPDLLTPAWKRAVGPSASPLAGHCYIATEALWYALGGPKSGFTPQVGHVDGGTHWWLASDAGVLDPTAGQFDHPVDYSAGRGCGFLTKGISKRARIVLARALAGVSATESPIAGTRVRVYRNLHTGTWSCQDTRTGRVTDHPDQVGLVNATLVVRPGGRDKVRATGRKNVHAFVVGTVAGPEAHASSFATVVQATYNPYRYDSFVAHTPGDGTEVDPITEADYVWLDAHNRVFCAS